mmetsp:Transcript_14752/g.27708  ORF Transcript_14752/g.27708 Transcript_14752/m.27708 type:complete len:138 (+) Transcript_14752:1-414(+)
MKTQPGQVTQARLGTPKIAKKQNGMKRLKMFSQGSGISLFLPLFLERKITYHALHRVSSQTKQQLIPTSMCLRTSRNQCGLDRWQTPKMLLEETKKRKIILSKVLLQKKQKLILTLNAMLRPCNSHKKKLTARRMNR